uniref:CUB domain-containing protein n=1 Tax=Tetranychus urticae TaxID=32264 RepID=T1K866_TETUR
MTITLSIWSWVILTSGIVQATHSATSSHNQHESSHLLTTFPSGSFLIQRDKPITSHGKPSIVTSPESSALFSTFTRPKQSSSNGSNLIASFHANHTHRNLLRYPLESSKTLTLHGSHYFVQNLSCDNIELLGGRGSIFNPGYPYSYTNETFCSWTLTAKPHEIITLSFDDLDIPEIVNSCNPSLGNSIVGKTCCQDSAVIIQSIDNKTIPERRFCGRSEDNRDIFQTYISEGESIKILFNGIYANRTGGRGFHATYSKTWIGKPCVLESESRCSNGKCIDKSWMCNRRDECGDNSDEANCDHVCRESNEAQCLNEDSHTFSCYSFPKDRCDGNWNCANGTDERSCDKCPHGMFVCSAGLICYSERARCNGNWDCVDFKDELNCGLCGPDEISCGCDGVFDCPNAFDEMGCEKHRCAKKILCANNAKCFFRDERCNGIADCSDGSDERNCTKELCRHDHGAFLCANGQCIHSIQVCDTSLDCDDGSDEINCTTEQCRPEQGNFLCTNGNCIQAILTCDRSNDCGDSSDEINCLKNSVITAALMGSLICGLLLVIAISCTCKLIALRQIEQQRQAQDDSYCGSATNNLYSSSHIYQRYFPFARSNSHSTSPLFSPDSEYFYREPPPSYASAVSGIDEYGAGCSSSSSRRRPRRLRPRGRRRPPSPPPSQQSLTESDGIYNTGVFQRPSICSNIPATMNILSIPTTGSINIRPTMNEATTSSTLSATQSNAVSDIEEPNCTTSSNHPLLTQNNQQSQNGDISCSNERSSKNEDEDGSSQSTEIGPVGSDDSNDSIHQSYHHNCSTSSTVTIELNNIPSQSSQLDCDQQPLLSG